MFGFRKVAARRQLSLIKRVSEIYEIQDDRAFRTAFENYLGSRNLSNVKKINHKFCSDFIGCLGRYGTERMGELHKILRRRPKALADSIEIPFYVFCFLHGSQDLSVPSLDQNNSRFFVLAMRISLLTLDDRKPLQNLYDEHRNSIDISAFSEQEFSAFLSFLVAIRKYDDLTEWSDRYSEKVNLSRNIVRYVAARRQLGPIKRVSEIYEIQDDRAFRKAFENYLGSRDLSNVKKINHKFCSDFIGCLDRYGTERMGELQKILRKRPIALADSIEIPFYVFCFLHGSQDLSVPSLDQNNSRFFVLAMRISLLTLDDRKPLQNLYDEHRNSIDISAFSEQEFSAFLSFLVAIRKYDDLIESFDRYSETVNLSRNIVRHYAHALLYVGAYQKLRDIKDSLIEELDESDYSNFILSLRPAALDDKDAEFLMYALDKKYVSDSRIFEVVQLLFKKGVSYTEVQHHITDEGLSDFQKVRIEEMSLEADQEKMLLISELKDTDYSDFVNVSSKLEANYKERFSNCPADVSELYQGICRLEAGAAESWTLTESSFDHALKLARVLNHRIRNQEPTSLIRIGDGEALFLPSEPSSTDSDLLERAQRQLIHTWWGDNFSHHAADYSRLTDMIAESVAAADIVGVVPKWRIFDDESYAEQSARQHRLSFLKMARYFEDQGPEFVSRKYLTSCHVHQSLIRWDLYREVFRGVDCVSVVSCHRLGDTLAKRFGLAIKHEYLIPAENAYSSRFSDTGIREPMFPNVLERIEQKMCIEPGEVYLIAAGFIGKHLCKLVKEKGGIGIDIGSAADYFMGHQTRVFAHNEVEVEPRSYLINGAGFETHKLEKSERQQVFDFVTTDDRCHKVISLPSVGLSATSAPSHKVLLTGHPRCASGYVSDLMSKCGINLGHERYSRDGICSWMHAVRDCNMPWGDSPVLGESFQLILAYARNPLASLPSIAMENCQARSFSFRRYHIYDLMGVDIAEFETPLERAIASFVYWYKVVLENKPAGIIRVEHLEQDLAEVMPSLNEIGFRISAQDVELARRKDIRKNDSKHKFSFEKPRFSTEDWCCVDDKLMKEIVQVSRELGYSDITAQIPSLGRG